MRIWITTNLHIPSFSDGKREKNQAGEFRFSLVFYQIQSNSQPSVPTDTCFVPTHCFVLLPSLDSCILSAVDVSLRELATWGYPVLQLTSSLVHLTWVSLKFELFQVQ